ncbi:hypothetical protein R1sor_011480 [Riccia sorocarpa]|uniref:Reverse transcriptase domain-containing protein n=1 Tax=Riccia sorocarpa TaxID=122646 RepID=A0ABD3I2V1_9MARC
MENTVSCIGSIEVLPETEPEDVLGETIQTMVFSEDESMVLKQKVEDAWHNETEVVRDARRRWARGWCRVKQVLREARSEMDRKRKMEGSLEAEVEWRMSQLQEDSTEEEAEALWVAETRAREQALQEAREWRLRSRVRWLLEDEAPSKYFFAKLRAKWARDTLEALETTEGELLTDREEILTEVHEFYQDLYEAEVETEEKQEAREELVGLIQNKLEPHESEQLARIPEKPEIESVVFGMATNKAPGQDGLTIEILKLCWSFVGDDCVKLIQCIWAKKRILPSDCQTIIRLIHKGGDRKLLGNLRPISLMTLSYEIVTKLLANRIRSVLPKLVDS